MMNAFLKNGYKNRPFRGKNQKKREKIAMILGKSKKRL